MNIESPKQQELTEEQKEKEEMRYRVMKLKGGMYDLAYGEKEYREELAKDGIKEKLIEKISDRDSTKELEKLELIKEGYKDKLTELWNRKAFEEHIPPIIDGLKRKNGKYSLIMIDCDDFKIINDTYGHLIGDRVLSELAGAIKKNTRSSDYVFRYGGEEFVVFFPDTDSENAFNFAERIREYIKKMDIGSGKDGERGIIINKTVSIGVFDADSLKKINNKINDDSSDKILAELSEGADRAMYVAKEIGKNKTVDYFDNRDEADRLAEEKKKKESQNNSL